LSALDPSYITLRQFAEARGMRTDKVAMQRLRRRLTKKQAHNPQAVFLIRLADGPSEPLYTTMPLMREHCGEFFDRKSEAETLIKKQIAEHFATINESMKGLISRQSALASKMREFKALLDEHLKSPHSASGNGIG
jgi:hypothetical protein